jgi:serine protease Do
MTTKSLLKNPLLAAAIGAAVVAAPGAAYFYSTAPHAEQTPAVVAANPASAPAAVTVRNGLPDFSTLVKAYGPAVVNISVKANVKTSGGAQFPSLPGFGPDDPFSQFFRGLPAPRGSVPVHGEGSGFIISPDGTILTNAHVVADATNVTVKLTDRREYEAKVLGVDEKTDVAVIKINAKSLPVVRFGKADDVQVGEWVVAIGSPFGFENSVTAGIVSAKGRTLPDGSYVPFLQTDVAVNPGNSGGPLFNLNGDVIGINSQIYSRSGGYEGVSFAIPIDVALDVSRQLQANGKVSRGKLGVGIQELDQKLADSFGLDSPRGALVSSVEDGGPAAKAGLEAGDVILEFDGHPIGSASELPVAVAQTPPGKNVELKVWRKNSEKHFDLKLGELEETQAVAADSGAAEGGRLGLAVRPLTPDERRQVGVDGGLLIEDVHGAAEDAGLRPGDIVLSANGHEVDSVQDLRKLVAGAKDHVALLVQRDDARIFVPVELG